MGTLWSQEKVRISWRPARSLRDTKDDLGKRGRKKWRCTEVGVRRGKVTLSFKKQVWDEIKSAVKNVEVKGEDRNWKTSLVGAKQKG